MVLTAAEKQRLYRERLKAKGLYEKIKEKDRKRKVEKRQSLTAVQLKKMRLKEKINKQNCRRRILQTSTFTEISPYKSPKTLSKAVCRVSRALPSSPRKCLKVVKEIASKYIPQVKCLEQAKAATNRKVSQEIENCVSNFYQKNDISWQAPGKKDCITLGRMAPRKKYRNISYS